MFFEDGLCKAIVCFVQHCCHCEISFANVIFAGVVANNGLLYVVGGDDGSSNLGTVECYDPKSNTWTLLTCSMMTGRSYAGVTVIDRPSY